MMMIHYLARYWMLYYLARRQPVIPTFTRPRQFRIEPRPLHIDLAYIPSFAQRRRQPTHQENIAAIRRLADETGSIFGDLDN